MLNAGHFNLIIFFISSLFLTEKAQSQAQFGVKAGLNISTVSFDDYDPKILLAFNAGVLSEVNFSEKVFLRPELLYSGKGWTAHGTSSSGSDITINLHYLNIPVLFGYRPINKISFLLGPEIGFLFKTVRKPEPFSVSSPYEKFDYGILAGTTYNINKNAGVEIRYTYGFDALLKVALADDNHMATGEVTRIGANRVFQMNVFYLFGNDKNEEPKYLKGPVFYIPKEERKVLMSLGFRLGVSNYTMFGGEVDLRKRHGAQMIAREGGMEIGVEAKFDIYKYFYAKIGFSYLQKGGHLEGGGWVYQDPVKVNYFSPSFLIGISPLKTKPITMSVEGGAGYNLLLHSENTYSNDIVSGYYVEKNDNIGSAIYGFEVSTDAINKLTLFLNYRNSRDLNFFHARKNDQTGENYDLWNQGYSVCLGIRIK